MHMDDLRVLASLWLSKTEEVHEDRAHWETNITGDIYGEGWISEMYGYAFGVAEPILLHYSLPFSVGNRSFSKLEHHEDGIVYDCRQLFPKPPYPREVKAMEPDPNKRRGLFLSIECINTMNEGLLLQHARHGCPMPKWSKYLSFLKSKTFVELTHPKLLTPRTVQTELAEEGKEISEPTKQYKKIHTIFYGICTDEDLKQYKGHDLPPARYVPSMSHHPLDYIVILDADMILRGPITPWEFKAARDRRYLIGCDNELAKIHTRHPDACDKVGGVIVMHIDDLWAFVLLWLLKTEGLKLRRRISSEILIYPGYVPQPDVQYRVFHYDLLSIEYAKTLNKALLLHHKRSNCADPTALPNPKPNTTTNVSSSRRFGRLGENYDMKSDSMFGNHSRESSRTKVTDGLFSTLMLWIVRLWVFFGIGFMSVMLVVFSGYTSKGSLKGKSNKNRRRSYIGFLKMNDRDGQTRKSEAS
uniref:Uncharacterized protein n=1 Tax=Gossypium raimondii TaxID=29730 RepID=A0A0D2PXD2_GOSRA|nr:hypothetical protein B456_001G267700 [Gossypium raimondii]